MENKLHLITFRVLTRFNFLDGVYFFYGWLLNRIYIELFKLSLRSQGFSKVTPKTHQFWGSASCSMCSFLSNSFLSLNSRLSVYFILFFKTKMCCGRAEIAVNSFYKAVKSGHSIRADNSNNCSNITTSAVASHPLTPNRSRDLVIVEVPLKLGGHVVVRLLLVIWLPL